MNRRQFLINSSGAIVASHPLSSVFLGSSNNAHATLASSPQDSKLFKRSQWLSLVAIQEHLFPAKNGAPGASQFNAKGWLYTAINQASNRDQLRDIYVKQIERCNTLSLKAHKKVFIKLDEKAKESVLRELEQNRQSQRWLAEILNYLIEALLTDPVYGSNTNGIGWKWLDHRPGFPRPDNNTRYFSL